MNGGREGTVSEALCQAYSAAETLRPFLVQQRQKIAAENNDSTEIKDEDDPGMLTLTLIYSHTVLLNYCCFRL